MGFARVIQINDTFLSYITSEEINTYKIDAYADIFTSNPELRDCRG